MGLLPHSARVSGSSILGGTEMIGVGDDKVRALRGKRIAMIFQDPLSALNPVHRVGAQIVEMIQAHQNLDDEAANKRAVELLDLVGLPQPSAASAQVLQARISCILRYVAALQALVVGGNCHLISPCRLTTKPGSTSR